MELPFVTLDVFTDTALEGNPLAVVSIPASLEAELTQAKKQKIAQEFNLSETVFMHEPRNDDQGNPTQLPIDIFTVESELPFAGHPTIGSAVLAKFHRYPDVTTLLTKSGPIHLEVTSTSTSAEEKQSVRARISHDVRVHQKTLADAIPEDQHASYPGLSHHLPAVREAELRAPVCSIVRGMTFVLVKVPSLELLGQLDQGLRLDFDRLPQPLLDADRQPAGFVARYYYVDQGGQEEEGVRKIRTRMLELGFEDPATGSAASSLTAFLALDADKTSSSRPGESVRRFEVTQGVEMGRRSVIHVETRSGAAEEQGKIRELWLGGQAVMVQKGTLMVN
ncbi:phenazine biosynthesis protein [Apiospora arundinis]